MALVESEMLPLGSRIPDLALLDTVSGTLFDQRVLQGEPVLLTVICNHCPYVVHIKQELVRLGKDLVSQGVKMIAVSSNDADTYPQDGPLKMAEDARTYGYPFPYLYDEDQRVAHELLAACTPEFYLFSAEGLLVYRGRLDDSTPGNGRPVTGNEVRRAVDALLNDAPPVETQLPSIGCSIKWKRG